MQGTVELKSDLTEERIFSPRLEDSFFRLLLVPFGADSRTRTYDLRIKSLPLYQLSYIRILQGAFF